MAKTIARRSAINLPALNFARSALAIPEKVRRSLATLDTPSKVANEKATIAAGKEYAAKIRASRPVRNALAEADLLLTYKAGEVLSLVARSKPGKRSANALGSQTYLQAALSEMGIGTHTAHQWQTVFRATLDRLDSYFAAIDRDADEMSLGGYLSEIKESKKKKKRSDRVASAKSMCEALEGRSFALIYADPPWEYDYSPTDSRKIENQYETLAVDQIAALPVAEHANENSVLFLWATNPKLLEAIDVLAAWGFEYRTNAVWVKHAIGMGYYFRQRHELLLVGTRGELPSPEGSNRPDSVIEAKRGKHSEKPVRVYDLLDQMYPEFIGEAYRAELFARRKQKDWFSWGNEVA